MPDKRRPLWFRFSLRSLFVLMTVLCCWLGWELSIVRHRQSVRKELEVKGVIRFWSADNAGGSFFAPRVPSDPVATIPFTRRMLGDEAIQEIQFERYRQGFSDTDLELAKKAFPEAKTQELLPEPCHPGCFPAGTLVDTAEGPRAIESIVPGDVIVTYLPTGEVSVIAVSKIFVTENWLWTIKTDAGDLITTQTQPLCVALDQVVQVGKLAPGDVILKRQDGKFVEARVLSVASTEKSAKVYNLILGDSEVFVAGGFVSRSKPPAVVER